MQQLFRGYLPTKNKSPLIKFKDAKPLSEVKDLPEYAGLLAEDVILIDIDNYEQSEKLMTIVEDLQLSCRVYETTRGKHFLFHGGNIEKCGTHLKLAVGVEADIKIGNRNSISVLKFNGKDRKIIYDIEPEEEYEPAPAWLTPVKTKVDFNSLENGDGRNQTLFNYILTLQSAELSNDEIKEAITLLNKYVLPDSLDQAELDKILREDSFKKPVFFTEKGFDHVSAGKYVMRTHHTIKLYDQLYMYDGGVYVPCKNRLGGIIRNLVHGIKKNQLTEVTSYITDMSPVETNVADPKYIAFSNGIYNIETEQLEDFNPSIIITNKIPHKYNYDAYNESMDSMLDRVSCNDDQIRDLLEEMAGFCLFRRNELRKAFILIGDKANGKSTFLDCVVNMVGEDNTSALDLGELKDRFRGSEMVGKLLNAGDDINDNFIADASMFKKVVSGERTTYEKKGVDAFKFSNYCKFIFSANAIPRMKDKTGAVLDRLIIIPFNATFSKKDPNYDPHIKSKLRSEEAMEYLLQLALDGLKRVLNNNGFSDSEKVREELEKYHEKNDPLIGFMKELDIEIDVLNQPSKDLYTAYKIYCTDNNLTPLAHNAFSENLKRNYNLVTVATRVNGKGVRIFKRGD